MHTLSGIYTSKGKAEELQLALEGRDKGGLCHCLVLMRTECGHSQWWPFGKCLFSAKWNLIALSIEVTSTGNTSAKSVSTDHLSTNQNINNKTFFKSQNFVIIHFKRMSNICCYSYYFIVSITLGILKLFPSNWLLSGIFLNPEKVLTTCL